MRLKRPSRLMREATRMRIAAERAALRAASEPFRGERSQFDYNRQRYEETRTLELLKDVPSVFYFLEQLGGQRPAWASMRYGAK